MPAGIIGRRTIKHRASRRVNPQANQPQPNNPVYITEAQAASTFVTLTFDQPVSLDGTPAFRTNVSAADPVSAAQTAPNRVVITYDATVDAASTLSIPYRDPAIRSATGGYVTSNQFPVATA